jgi:hypothetical protein
MVAETIEKLTDLFYIFACFKYLSDHTDLIPVRQRHSISPSTLMAFAYVKLSNGRLAIHPRIKAALSDSATRSKLSRVDLNIG